MVGVIAFWEWLRKGSWAGWSSHPGHQALYGTGAKTPTARSSRGCGRRRYVLRHETGHASGRGRGITADPFHFAGGHMAVNDMAFDHGRRRLVLAADLLRQGTTRMKPAA